MDTPRKKAVKIPHVKKARASVASEVSDRDQVETEHVGASYFLESRDFARGVEDVRAGRTCTPNDLHIGADFLKAVATASEKALRHD